MGHWNRDRDCEPAQLTEYQATVRARMGTSHRERDSSAYRAQKPRPGRPEARVCYLTLARIRGHAQGRAWDCREKRINESGSEQTVVAFDVTLKTPTSQPGPAA